MKGQRFANIEETKTESQKELNAKIAFQISLKIGKSVGTSVLYLIGTTLKGTK